MYLIKFSNGSYLDRFSGCGELSTARGFSDQTLCAILAKSSGGTVVEDGIERAQLSSNAYCKASVWNYAILPVVTDWSNWAIVALGLNGIVTLIDLITLVNAKVQ